MEYITKYKINSECESRSLFSVPWRPEKHGFIRKFPSSITLTSHKNSFNMKKSLVKW
jgi:hypothetical protein